MLGFIHAIFCESEGIPKTLIVNGFKKLNTTQLKAYKTYTKLALEKLFVIHQLTNCFSIKLLLMKNTRSFCQVCANISMTFELQ